VEIMAKLKRTWRTVEQKEEILQDAAAIGIAAAARKHGTSAGMIYDWRKKIKTSALKTQAKAAERKIERPIDYAQLALEPTRQSSTTSGSSVMLLIGSPEQIAHVIREGLR
jgi:hypothetical protein